MLAYFLVLLCTTPRSRRTYARTAWQVGGVQAIAQWQRGIVAIGVRREPLSESELIGTGFIVDMTAGIISTCAHVVLDVFYGNDGSLDPGVDGASGGYAIGVGIGERVQWICRADLRCISQPPASYAENLCSVCRKPQGPQAAPQQRRCRKRCVHCNALERQQKQFLTGPPPEHWRVQDSADLGALDLALLQLSDVSGKPLAEQTEPGTGLPVLTLWPRCLRDGWSADLGFAADHPRGLPIPAEAAGPLLADLACALRLGHASTLQDGEPFVMLGYGQHGTGTGQDQTSTTTRGHFSGSYASSTTGDWYKTTVTILSGHSGGPVLNRHGEVIGWAVRSTTGLGQLRPVERLLDALPRVLEKVAPGRPGATVRDQLLGHIPESERLNLGDGATWEAATRILNEASEAAALAQASAEQATDAAQQVQAAIESARQEGERGAIIGLAKATLQQGIHQARGAVAALQAQGVILDVEFLGGPLSGAPQHFSGMRNALEPITLREPGTVTGHEPLAPAMKPKQVVIQTAGDIAAISMPAQQEEFKSALASELELSLPPDIITLQADDQTVQITRRGASIVLSGLTKMERRGVEVFVAERLAFNAADLTVIPIAGSLYLHIAGPAWAMLLLTQLFLAGDDSIRQLLLARGLGEPLNIRVAPPEQQRVPHAARIVALLEDPDADVRAAALQAFHALPEQQRVPHAARIVSLLEDPDANVRVAALQSIQALPEQEGVPHAGRIVSLLEDPDAGVQVAALQAFHALPAQQRVPHATRIVSLLESPDAGVRQEAYRAIQSVGPLSDVVRARHIAIAVSQLDDPDAGVHRAVLGALALLSEEERVGNAAALIKYCWRQLETLHPSSRRFSDEDLHQAGWPLIKGLGNNSLSSQFPPCADWPVGLCSSVASAFVSGRLDLSELGLSSLPSAILPPSCPDHFMSLRKLNLSGNGLTHLPDVMWQLISLEQINLSQNKLSELSARITKMPRLTRLDAADNPLQMPPIGVVSRGIASVKAYFEELEQFGGGLSRQLKLVVLGDGEAGKTSIVRGLKSCTPKPARADERTVQLDISQLRVGSGASAVTLDVWDLGGQQRYAAVQQAFLVGGVSCRGACASCRGALRRGAWSVARLSRCSCPWRSGAARSLACGQTSARSHIARATGACPCR